MDGTVLEGLFKGAANFGIPGIVLVLWYLSEKSHGETLRQYREDMTEQRQMVQEGMREIRRVYESNAEAVKNWSSLAGDLKDVVIANTRTWQKVCDDINRNQFCPMVRLWKAPREESLE